MTQSYKSQRILKSIGHSSMDKPKTNKREIEADLRYMQLKAKLKEAKVLVSHVR